MVEYRIREVQYGDGRREFYPEVCYDLKNNHWERLFKTPDNLTYVDYVADNLHICTSYDEALSLIERAKYNFGHTPDANITVIDNIIHKVS